MVGKWLPWALVIVLLAGCASPSDELDETDNADGEDARPATIQYRDCFDAAGRFEIPVETARAMLPEEFEPALGGELGLNAVVFVTTYECPASVDGETWETSSEMTTMILVEPPEGLELTNEGLQDHGYLVDWVVSSSMASAFYDEWDLPHRQGDVTNDLTMDNPVARQTHTETTTDDGAFVLDSVHAGPRQPFGAGTVRCFYTASVDGETHVLHFDVAWEDIPNTGQATGTMEHGQFGQLASRDLFHAWTYDWTMTFTDIGPLAAL